MTPHSPCLQNSHFPHSAIAHCFKNTRKIKDLVARLPLVDVSGPFRLIGRNRAPKWYLKYFVPRRPGIWSGLRQKGQTLSTAGILWGPTYTTVIS